MSSVWHLESPSSSVWRSELCLHFDIQSHCPTWHSVPPSLFSFGVQSRFFPALSSIVMALGIHIRWHCTSCLHDFYVHPHFPHLVTLCLSLVHYVLLDFSFPCTWHSPLSSWHIFRSCYWGTLHLASSCSSHKAVPFGRILSCTRRWFNCYSALTSIFESLLETS